VAAQAPTPKPLLWMAMAAIGGAVLIAGVIGIGKWMARSAQPAAGGQQLPQH
jgi:hypothetical protein